MFRRHKPAVSRRLAAERTVMCGNDWCPQYLRSWVLLSWEDDGLVHCASTVYCAGCQCEPSIVEERWYFLDGSVHITPSERA